jgi:hypothetical protein
MILDDLAYQKAQCETTMHAIDNLSAAMRDVVYEFGIAIVASMINDGYDDPAELRRILDTRRWRMQEQWLATDHITPARAEIIKAAFLAPPRPATRLRMRRRQCR